MDDCVFCGILNGTVPSDKVYEDDQFYVFRDIHPVAPTHILVITRQHIAGLDDIDDPLLLGKLILMAKQIAASEGLLKGYRLVINNGAQGGQTVPHLHVHMLSGRKLGWPPG